MEQKRLKVGNQSSISTYILPSYKRGYEQIGSDNYTAKAVIDPVIPINCFHVPKIFRLEISFQFPTVSRICVHFIKFCIHIIV